MNKVLAGMIIGGLGVFAYQRMQQAKTAAESAPESAADTTILVANDAPGLVAAIEPEKESPFRCDGRTYCSQMTSCAEATWFLQNCPNVEMDGEGDGVPCEKQWCGRP